MSARRLKRERLAAAELEESTVKKLSDELYSRKADEELFFVDTVGSKTKKRKIEKDKISQVVNNNIVSNTEQTLVKKALTRPNRGKLSTTKAAREITDIWAGDDRGNDFTVTSKSGKNRSGESIKKPSRITKVVVAGQSYNPSQIDHQNALAEALALELKKKEQEDRELALANGGNNTSVGDVLAIDYEDEEDEEEPDGDGNGEPTRKYSALSRRAREKKTKAMRNKERQRKIANHERFQKDREKLVLKAIGSVPQLLKEIEFEERLQENKREVKRLKKLHSLQEAMERMTSLEASAVPLSDELGGSLRCIRPKGLPVLSQVDSLVHSGDAMAKDRRKKRAFESPHGSKRVKWFAKYKC